MVDGNWRNFRVLFDMYSQAVEERARYDTYGRYLEEWFACIDRTPVIATEIGELEKGADFEAWLTLNPGSLPWFGKNKLGMQLSMFRHIANNRETGYRIAERFKRDLGSLEESVTILNRELFHDFARDLISYLEARFGPDGSAVIPASDRVVTLNHNSVTYSEMISALETLKRGIEGSNDYPDRDDQEQASSELSAVIQLLQNFKVRVGVVLGILGPIVLVLGKQFANSGIGRLASLAWDKVIQVLCGLM